MRALARPAPAPSPAPAPREEISSWAAPTEDDFASVAAQARLGVQRKTVDEAAKRKKQRLITACVAAVTVAAGIVMLIEKFYDPEARARERAIAAEVSRMAEQQKVTDDLTLTEVGIEQAIMANDFELARSELAKLVEKSPAHPRREFLQASIDRAAELARLAAQSAPKAAAPAPERSAAARPAPRPERRAPERIRSAQIARDGGSTGPRVYGAPVGEPLRPATIPLDAPINAAPSNTAPRGANSFGGRTVEASDSSQGAATSALTPSQSSSGTAVVAIPPAAPPAPAVPAPVDIVPAKLVKRVAPVVSYDVPRKTHGHVVVNIEITETGRVGNVTVMDSTPRGVFDEAALSAVRKWQYEPRKENGVAVASVARARLVFEALD
jgi:TonB family protein